MKKRKSYGSAFINLCAKVGYKDCSEFAAASLHAAIGFDGRETVLFSF